MSFATKKNENKEFTSAYLNKKKFFEIFYQTTCKSNLQIRKLFTNESLSSTIQGLNFIKPKNEKQCQQIFKSWNKNPYTPYLCRLPNILDQSFRARLTLRQVTDTDFEKFSKLQSQITLGTRITKDISFKKRSFVRNLCQHINDQEKFCDTYLKLDLWQKVKNLDQPDYYLKFRCMKNESQKLTRAELSQCADALSDNDNLCRIHDFFGHHALFPMPGCKDTSTRLMSSHLNISYLDCPTKVENEGIINMHRLVMHFNPRKVDKSLSSCVAETNLSFAKLNLDYGNDKAWPLKICYDDKILQIQKCTPYVPGHHPTSKLSETKVLTDILVKTRGHDSTKECRLIDFTKYNPDLLEFKTGCYVVFDQNKCQPLNCPKKIIYNQVQVTGLRYTGIPLFHYFETSYSDKKLSANNILAESLRLQSKQLENLTEINYFLKTNKNGLIHGIACAEDLHPRVIKREGLYSCRPLPFIVDGLIQKDSKTYMTLRSAINHLHAPGLISFNNLYTAIKNFQIHHPLKLWTLYGLKKNK